jgi:serralysin
VRTALGQYAAVSNLTFTEVTESSTKHGDLRFALSDYPYTAWAYYPSTNPAGGDAWFNKSSGWYSSPGKGNYAYMTFLHEAGHCACGLDHAHEGRAVPYEHDSMEYTVMSYRSYVGADVNSGYTNETYGYAQSLMMYDIAATQYMYGANFNTQSGNTTYTWSPTTGEMFINGVGQGRPGANRIFLTVWDGNGVDTYDFSNYSTSLKVDLRPGEWTTTSTAQLAKLKADGSKVAVGNIANALQYNGDARSLIENAKGGSAGDVITGNDIANTLWGNGGNDTLNGLLGNDILVGGAGFDTLDGGAGLDTADYSDKTYTVEVALNGANNVSVKVGGKVEDTLRNVENVTGGSAADKLTGDALANVFTGNGGNDTLNGGAGSDTAVLRGARSQYTITKLADGSLRIVDNRSGAPDGTDIATSIEYFRFSDRTYSYAELTSTTAPSEPTDPQPPQPPSADMTLTGDDTANVLEGGSGNDKLYGKDGNDRLVGKGGNDTLDGGDDNDLLDGGAGADKIVGGSGSDTVTYAGAAAAVVANLSSASANTGDAKGDTYSSVENMVGSAFADTLTGNGSANVLEGGAGGDRLVGGSGRDTASYSGALSGVKADLNTGAGYTGDAFGDTFSSIENLTGSAYADQLFGNGSENVLIGGSGNDILDGRGDDDDLFGGDGNDTLIGGAGEDVLNGGAGIDTASYATATSYVVADLTTTSGSRGDADDDEFVSVENMIGSAYGDTLKGDAGANVIDGGEGADRLYGRGGQDTLIGGAGADTFVFDSALGASNVDRIADFKVVDDTIQLDDAVFKGVKTGQLSQAAFYAGSAAHDADDRIIYNANTGALSYDADGNGSGAAVQFATLNPGLSLTSADFYVV